MQILNVIKKLEKEVPNLESNPHWRVIRYLFKMQAAYFTIALWDFSDKEIQLIKEGKEDELQRVRN